MFFVELNIVNSGECCDFECDFVFYIVLDDSFVYGEFGGFVVFY